MLSGRGERGGEVVTVEWRQKCIIICTDEFDALLCCLLTLAKTVSAAGCAHQLRFDCWCCWCSRCYANGSSRFYSYTLLSICLGCVPS